MIISRIIPSDTEAFDKKVVEMKPKKLSPEREELNLKFSLLASRLSSFANFHLANENIFDEENKRVGGLGPLDIQNFVQSVVTNAQLMEFCSILQEKLMAMAGSFNGIADLYRTRRLGLTHVDDSVLANFFESVAKCLTTSETEIFSRTVRNLEEHIKGLQIQFGISITAEGVTVNERPKQSGGGTGPADTQKPN